MFELSQDHEDFRKVVRDFAEKEVALPTSPKWDAAACFPTDLVPKMGDLGLFGIPLPEEYGGAARAATSPPSASRSRRSAGSTSRSAITLSAGVGLGINPIYRFGTEEQKQRGCPTCGRARSAASASPSRRPAATPAAPAPDAVRERRRVGDRRREGVHHQLRHADHLGGHGDGPHRRDGQHRDLDDHGARRHAGLHRRAARTASWAGTPPTRTA